MADTDKVYIFDTTLRDGEQSAGIGFTVDEKVEIARALARLNVDIIEAGFPISSPGDLAAVAEVAKQVKGPVIAGLARAAVPDIDAVWEAVRHAETPRIHIFLSSSDIHLAQQLHKNREDIMEMTRAAVSHAARYTSDIEFSPMDATRSNPEFVYQLVEAAIDEGATTINIPDTVGYAIPAEFEAFIRSLPEQVPNMHKARISVHCQNDLGMATANSLAGILGGARQVEGTINGIGERAGNAALEEIIMAIRTRADFMNVHVDANPAEIYSISKLVERASGMMVQPHKAIVGKNAFRHSSGIHQDGVLKMRETYEIMDPEEIGIPGGSSIVLTKTSGRHGLQSRLEALGIKPADEEFQRIWDAFLVVADAKDEVDDRDLMAIVAEQTQIKIEDAWTLDLVQVSTGDHGTPTATIRLIGPDGEPQEDAAIGTGPVDAIYKAINRVTGTQNELTEFSVKSVTEGIDAQGEVTIRIETDGGAYQGRAADTDILVASARAYLHALNRAIATAQRQASHASV
jgi:2-isopropylmalate synthase